MPEANIPLLSNHEAIRAACATILGTLRLKGINDDDNSRIYQFMDPVQEFEAFPCAVCTLEGTQEEVEENSFESDSIGYPVNIWFFDRNARNWQQNLPQYLQWRKLALTAFRQQATLPEVPEVFNVKVRPKIIVDPALLDESYQHLATGFQVVAYACEVRVHDVGSAT